MASKTVVILGGGVGGLVAATELRRSLASEHRIVLVEKNPRHAFAPSFLWLMTGDRTPEQVTADVRQLVPHGVEVVIAEAQQIDIVNRAVQTSAQTLNYDYLVVALGAELAPEVMPGLAESAHTFYSFDGALKLRDALRAFDGGTIAVVVAGLPYKCPGAPHEGAMLIADLFRRLGLRDKVKVQLFTPEPQPMPVAGPMLGDAVKQMVTKAGVEFCPLHKLTKVDGAARELTFDGKGSFKYDLLVTIPPHRSPRVVREGGMTNEAGWVPADRATLETKFENVYALGDVAALPIPGRWKPDVPMVLPKAGVFAHCEATVVARRIADQVAGTSPRAEFDGVGYCMLEAGEHMAGFAYGNFFAEPSPQVEMRQLGGLWHIGKVLFEQWWLAPQGIKRDALGWALTLGSKGLQIPTPI